MITNDTEFGFVMSDADTQINGIELQHLLNIGVATQTMTLLNEKYVTEVPDIMEPCANVICRVFKDEHNRYYMAFLSYDAISINCMYRLNKVYLMTPKTYTRAWHAYVSQVRRIRSNMITIEQKKKYTNDLFGESYGVYSNYYNKTGEELPTAARKFSRVLGYTYKFLYLDKRVD